MTILMITDFYKSDGRFHMFATDGDSDTLTSPDCNLDNIILIDDKIKTARWINKEWVIEGLIMKLNSINTRIYSLTLKG